MADPTEEEAKRYDRDITALRDAVAAIVLAWASVENSMVALLTAILNVPNFRIPAALYFSLSAVRKLSNRPLIELDMG
jgi:hypothetical protein